MAATRPSFATLFGGLDPDSEEVTSESDDGDDDANCAETMQTEVVCGLVADGDARKALLASEEAHAAVRLELARATAAADDLARRIHVLEREHARELEARATELRAMGEVAALQSLARRAADSRADDAEARALAASRSTALPQHERASIALEFLTETGQGNVRLASTLSDETLAAFLDSALPAAQQQLAREVSARPVASAARLSTLDRSPTILLHTQSARREVAAAAATAANEATVCGSANEPEPQLQNCVVCLTHPRCVVLLNCGHLVVCASCAPGLALCPMCRAPVHDRRRVFSP